MRTKRRHRKKRSTKIAQLNITALMDMFTIILLFLLQTFSAEGQAFTSTETFKLPESTAVAPITPELMVQITQDEIIVEGKVVVDLKDIRLGGDTPLIKPLEDALTEIAKQSVYIAKRNEELELSRTVIIMGDRRIPFELLEAIMYTSGRVGYNNLSLAVVSNR